MAYYFIDLSRLLHANVIPTVYMIMLTGMNKDRHLMCLSVDELACWRLK